MPPQQKKLDFAVIWSSLRCDEFPPTNLTNNNPENPTFFLTDKVTDRVIVRLDFTKKVVILGAVVESSTASHIEVRTSVFTKEQERQQDTHSGYGARGVPVLEKKQFIGPLGHRQRIAKAREHNEAVSSTKVQLKGILTEAYKIKTLFGGSREKYEQQIKFQEEHGVIEPPPFVQYLDIDIRGSWEPMSRLGLQSIAFIGYEVEDEEVEEYQKNSDRVQDEYKKRVEAAAAALRPSVPPVAVKATTTTKPKTNSNDNNDKKKSPEKESGQRRPRDGDEKEDTQQLTNTQQNDKAEDEIWDQVNSNKNNTNINIATTSAPPPLPPQEEKKKPVPSSSSSDKPLKGCVIALSGYQNPLRGQLRDIAIKLGAGYSQDWNKNCTHLICAVDTTPKYIEVNQSGHGWIVDKSWLDDCEVSGEKCGEEKYTVGTGGPDNK